jgi:uncharacterized protein (UPF0332 family)
VHNRSLAVLVDARREEYRDWLVTVYFYLIVHLVEASLATKGIHSSSHTNRRELIGRHMGQTWETEYERLLVRTRAYRYECERPSEADLTQLLSKAVGPFIVYLCKRLSPEDSGRILLQDLHPV